MLSDQGPTGVFDSTMSGTVTRLCDIEFISASVTFSVLEFQLPTGQATEIPPNLTYTSNLSDTLKYVKRFRVSAGTVLVHFYYPRDSAGGTLPPFTVTGLILWAKPDSLIAGGLVDGSPVTTWPDSSGAGNHLLQTTGASKPIFKTGIVNSQPIVRFDGLGQFMQSTSTIGSHTSSSIFIVRNNSSNFPGLSIAQGASVDEEMLCYTTAILHHSSAGGGFQRRNHQNPTPSGFFVQAGNFGTSQLSLDLWLNGVLATPALVVGGAGGGPYASTARTAFLAKRNETVAVFCAMDVAEVLVYNSVLSNPDRIAVQNYLGAKYGIAV